MDLDLTSPADLRALAQQARVVAGMFAGAEIRTEYEILAHAAWVLAQVVPEAEPRDAGGKQPALPGVEA